MDALHGVLANDTDPDTHDNLHVTAVGFGRTTVPIGSSGHATIKGDYGTLLLNSDGSYTYAANQKGHRLGNDVLAQDRFTYTADDGHGGNSQSILTITITNENQQYIAGRPGQTLRALQDEQVLDGGLGNQMLIGGRHDDVLIGGPNDTLVGGRGSDMFVFGPGFGKDTIVDLDIHHDEIQFDKSVFQLVSAIAAHASDSAAGAVITDGHGDSITLAGVTAAQLASRPSVFHLA